VRGARRHRERRAVLPDALLVYARPASLLVTSHHDHGLIGQLPPEWLAHEYYDDDLHKLADVARSARGISTLHEATGGDPSRSRAWRDYVQPHGGDQQLFVALRTQTGPNLGDAQPLPGAGRRASPSSTATTARSCARRRRISPRAPDAHCWSARPPSPRGPARPLGLIVLAHDWSVESLTPGVERWLCELPDGGWEARGKLPPAVLAVAGRALRTADSNDAPGEVALARVLSNEGRWIMLHGASLVANGAGRAAVIIEPAHPARISPLLMSAHGLTDREQDVTRLVLHGDSTAQIAGELYQAEGERFEPSVDRKAHNGLRARPDQRETPLVERGSAVGGPSGGPKSEEPCQRKRPLVSPPATAGICRCHAKAPGV
jgi:hypothetical protein